MIYGNLQHSQQYTGISPRLDCALTYLQTHDLNAMEPGRYPILGEDVWLRISDNSTKPESEAVYEAHDRFIDIQMILRERRSSAALFVGTWYLSRNLTPTGT